MAKIGDRSSDRLEISPNIDVDAPTVTVAEVTVVDTDVRADGKADKVTVKGSSDEANAPFTIKDKDGNIIKEGVTDNDGKFEVAIDTDTVQSGDKVTVEVIDKAGNIRSVHKYANNLIYEDKTAPVVTIQEIKSIDTDSTADGRADETRVKFTVDDPTATLDVKGPNFQTPSQIIDNLDGSKTAIFNEGFAKGDEITITATDKAGNKGQDSKKVSDISFEDTTPPTVQISELTLQDIDNDDTPNRADNKAEFISIKGNSDAKNTTFEIYHNGNKIGEGTTNNKGEFQARIPNTNKAVELNDEITVKIKDKAGNVGEATKTANKITHENLVVEIVEDKYDANGNLSINGVERGDNYLNKSELGNKNTVSARITLPENTEINDGIHLALKVANLDNSSPSAINMGLRQISDTRFEVVRGSSFLKTGTKLTVEDGAITIDKIPVPADGKIMQVVAAYQKNGGSIQPLSYDEVVVDKTVAELTVIAAETISDERGNTSTIVTFTLDDGNKKLTELSSVGKVSLTGGSEEVEVKAFGITSDGKYVYRASFDGDITGKNIEINAADRAGNVARIHVDVDSKLLSTQKDVGSDMFGDDNAQTINGTDKNEFIDGKGGRDTINAGSGDDTVAFDANDESINGGDGADTLLITDTIDLTKIQTDIVGFEKIVLQNEDKNLKLAIDGLKVRDMLDVKENGQDNILEIIGKNGDVLGLKGFAEITDAKEIAGDSNRFEAEISSKMGEYKFYKTTVDESTFYVQVSRHIEVKQDENIF